MNPVDAIMLKAGVASVLDIYAQLKKAVMSRDIMAISVLMQALQEELLAHEKVVGRVTALDVSK